MTIQKYRSGDILFRKDEKADRMLYIKKGQIRFIEIDKVIGPGELIGEMALFLPDSKRTMSIECKTDCELYSLAYDEVHKIAYNNPELSYYLAQLMIGRILESRVIPGSTREKQLSIDYA
jgi:CRP-like cAMP-binding protein